jgi:hypothetical protein
MNNIGDKDENTQCERKENDIVVPFGDGKTKVNKCCIIEAAKPGKTRCCRGKNRGC